MRWDSLAADSRTTGLDGSAPATPSLSLALTRASARSFPTPDFAGTTFYEIQAKSIINRVPRTARVPFEWTVNPYRGCSHACVYCFARNTHTYLGLNAGADFDRRVIVKLLQPPHRIPRPALPDSSAPPCRAPRPTLPVVPHRHTRAPAARHDQRR